MVWYVVGFGAFWVFCVLFAFRGRELVFELVLLMWRFCPWWLVGGGS